MDSELKFNTISDIFADKKFTTVSKVRSSTDKNRRQPRLLTEFSKEILAKLYLLANDTTVVDNNQRAEYIAQLLTPLGFTELGTGTNRIAFRKDGYVFKIALDRRGFIDNMSEYFRSIEYPQYLAKVYECNRTIIVMEYVNLMAEDEFDDNKEQIRKILDRLSTSYVIDDLGLTKKNYCNWGYRHSDEQIVALDYAYLYPIKGNESVMVCNCGGEIVPNSSYTGYKCTNAKCGLTYTASELHNHMRVRDSMDDAVLDIVGKDKKLYIQSDGDIELMTDAEVAKMKAERQKLLDEAKHTTAEEVNGSTPLINAIRGLQEQSHKVESIFNNMEELPEEMKPDSSGIEQSDFMAMLEQYKILSASNSKPDETDDEDDD